jgi:hypothetical protein
MRVRGMSKDPRSTQDQVEKIKRLGVIAVFSDDELLDKLVLKGGNALGLIHRVTTRASVDLDFSMEQAFAPGDLDSIRQRIEHRLKQTFAPEGYTIIDVRLQEKPDQISPEIASFWGGYILEFKLIATAKFAALAADPEAVRRNAVPIGPRNRTRFEIDISKFEYCAGKQAMELDGYTIYVYTPQMIVHEKLRAICQQMPEYTKTVKKHAAPRARDFLDIHDTVHQFHIDLSTNSSRELLRHMFAAKRVPLRLLGQVREYREFHRQDWPAVEATVRAGVQLKPFDFYFNFVVELCEQLKPFRDE